MRWPGDRLGRQTSATLPCALHPQHRRHRQHHARECDPRVGLQQRDANERQFVIGARDQQSTAGHDRTARKTTSARRPGRSRQPPAAQDDAAQQCTDQKSPQQPTPRTQWNSHAVGPQRKIREHVGVRPTPEQKHQDRGADAHKDRGRMRKPQPAHQEKRGVGLTQGVPDGARHTPEDIAQEQRHEHHSHRERHEIRPRRRSRAERQPSHHQTADVVAHRGQCVRPITRPELGDRAEYAGPVDPGAEPE